MLVAVDSETCLSVSEDETVAAQMLLPLGTIVPEFREIAPQRHVVEGEDYISMIIAAKTRSGNLLCTQAAADLVSPLKYSNAHATILDQIHGEE